MPTTSMDKELLNKMLQVPIPESYFNELEKRIAVASQKAEEQERRNNDQHFLNRVYSL